MAMELPRGPGEGSNDTTYKQNRFKAETWSIKKFGLPHRALFNCRKCSRGTSPKCMTDTKVQPHAGTMQRIWTRRVNTMRISRAKARSRILQTTEMATRSTQMGHHLPPQPEHNVIRTPPASNLSPRQCNTRALWVRVSVKHLTLSLGCCTLSVDPLGDDQDE